jgi:hypothetical protein
LGTPAVLRARTIPELNRLKADPEAVPSAGREFARTERIVVRVPIYGPGGTTPALKVHLLNRTGARMNELQAAPSPRPGEMQVEVPLAALAPGEYVLEIQAGEDDGGAKDFVAFRVTG